MSAEEREEDNLDELFKTMTSTFNGMTIEEVLDFLAKVTATHIVAAHVLSEDVHVCVSGEGVLETYSNVGKRLLEHITHCLSAYAEEKSREQGKSRVLN